MIIDKNLSKYSIKIGEILSDKSLSSKDRMEILLQFATKTYILYDNDKEFFMKAISDMYDKLEEDANILGFLDKK